MNTQVRNTLLTLTALAAGTTLLWVNTPATQPDSDSGWGRVTIAVEIHTETYDARPGDTALDALSYLDSRNPDLSLRTKDYVGLGTLVTAMYGKENGSENKYWQYRVNGADPGVGADSYELSDGDVVEWRFAAYELE